MPRRQVIDPAIIIQKYPIRSRMDDLSHCDSPGQESPASLEIPGILEDPRNRWRSPESLEIPGAL